MRDFSTLNLVRDPTVDGGTIDLLSVKDTTIRSVLEILCAVRDLDFDVRYGVVFISTPLRLWSTDPAIALPDFDDLVIEVQDGDIEEIEQTHVKQHPKQAAKPHPKR
jgi:hypothetical protein